MLLSEIRNKKLENSFTCDTVFIRDSVQFMQENLTDFSGIVLKTSKEAHYSFFFFKEKNRGEKKKKRTSNL